MVFEAFARGSLLAAMVDLQGKIGLRDVFVGLQKQMIARLSTDRGVIQHPGAKGEATELQWLEMLKGYLPNRYCADKAFVLDCKGSVSQQIDIVIYDRHYSPFLFNQDNSLFVPAESVYAVFEVKQDLSAATIRYASEKAGSVRRLCRTSARIPHAGGRYRPRKPPRILAGILVLDSGWSKPFGDGFRGAMRGVGLVARLDLGCVLKCGGFEIRYGKKPRVEVSAAECALIFYFLRLLGRLQASGTVPAMNFDAYSRVL